jgi:hypothetical protein
MSINKQVCIFIVCILLCVIRQIHNGTVYTIKIDTNRLNVKRPSFAPIQNHRQNYSFVYSNFYVLDSRREDKRFWTAW